MAKKRSSPEPMDAIAEIESRGERIIEWVGENARIVLGCAAVLLAIAAVLGYASGRAEEREIAASAAYEQARADYLAAMGAAPGALVAPELANPEAAAAIRREYEQRFRQVAEQHPDTTSGALARLEEGDLAEALGDSDAARAVWQAALDAAPADSGVSGLIHQRLGRSLEDAGDWAGAAQAHAAAADESAYPFRAIAMVDAARCYAAADDVAKALEYYARIEAEAPELRLPDDLRVRLKELRAAAQSG